MPACFDMPLEEMRTYLGTNPKPHDFDLFWDQALVELDRCEPFLTMKAADFVVPGVRCFDIYFTGIGGSRIHAKLVIPDQEGCRLPAVLRFHGYSGNAGDWFDLLPFAAIGQVVAALDCRGQGGLSEDRASVGGMTWTGHIVRGLLDGPEKLYYRSVFLDTVRLARIVMSLDEVDETRVSTTGHSQGGGLALACAALEPRIAKVSAQCPFLSDFKRVWEIDLLKDAYEELSYFLRRFDPRHERIDEIWNSLGYIDVHNLAGRIQARTHFVVGMMDTVCPPSTQFAAFNAVKSNKSMTIYPEFRHETYYGAADETARFLSWNEEIPVANPAS